MSTADAELPELAELAGRWSALHHGIDPRSIPLLNRWLRFMWAGGRVLHRWSVPPTAVTVVGVACAGGAVALARRRPSLAGIAVLAAAVCDGLDGATAVVRGRSTAGGAFADAIADRVSDAAFAAVLRRRGATPCEAIVMVALAWSVDLLRRLRGVPARVTVAERPTFTICALLACETGAVTSARRPARISAAVWIGTGLVGVVQLMTTPAANRRLRAVSRGPRRRPS